MNDARLKVLELLAQGKISVAEAERLLERLANPRDPSAAAEPPETDAPRPAEGPSPAASGGAAPAAGGSSSPGAGPAGAGAAGATPARPPRFMRIEMHTPGGQNLHVRVPLVLLRTGVGLGALLPEEARRRLAENGVDLHAFAGKSPDEFVQAVMDLNLNLHTPGGPSLRMYCE